MPGPQFRPPGSTLNNAMLKQLMRTKSAKTARYALGARWVKQRLKLIREISRYCNDGFTLAEILWSWVTDLALRRHWSGKSCGKFLARHWLKTPQSVVRTEVAAWRRHTMSAFRGGKLPETCRRTFSGGLQSTLTAMDACRFSEHLGKT